MLTPEKARNAINDYFNALAEKHCTGHAREHAYRPALETLITTLDQAVKVINDPSRSEHGNPDFVFLRNGLTVGYTETKDLNVNLDKIEKSEQMKRYLGYSNLILTDYLEFRFFKDGVRTADPIRIGNIQGDAIVAHPEGFQPLADALADFLTGEPEPIRSGKRLAEIMGGKARRIRDNITRFFSVTHDKNAELERVYEAIKKLLVHDLSTAAFADMYAQTLVYGLFVARYNDQTLKTFTRQEARDLVPASNPFLREFFDHIVGSRFDDRLQFIVDELCAVFAVSDVHLIVQKHLKLLEATDEKDPIIHFYEDFLKEYDPAERKRMGAYYTPIPVVRFIVRQVDKILKEGFGLAKGLADTSKRPITVTTQGMKPAKTEIHKVQVLDPAVGTATFLNEVIKHVRKNFDGQEGRWPSYVEADLLPRLHGFELMMAPYTIAHLKLGMTLQETGVKTFDQRLGVYLTNTLEEGIKLEGTLFSLGLSQTIAQEAEAAGKIKHEKPIMVVIGNPPYSGESSNKTDYAMSIVAKYKVEPGGKEKLKERNPKWINDDYVKFIAFAENMIEKNGEGVVAMITNHGYLDNPTFRGMRWHLAKTFDSIHVLDLHGNSKKKETAPDGGKDENVFDIQQGVAIIIAVKTRRKKSGEHAKVYHDELLGKRAEKFQRLQTSELAWQEISLDEKTFAFANINTEGKFDYDKGIKINEVFKVSSVGIVTARDGMSVQWTRAGIEKVVQDFLSLEPEELRNKYNLGKDARDWKVTLAKKDVIENFSKEKFVPISYRPFDTRYSFYTGHSKGFQCMPRDQVMQHFQKGENIGLMIARQAITDNWSHVQVVDSMADNRIHYSNKGIPVEIPLYLYHNDGTRTPNFDREILRQFTQNLQESYEPEDILDYIYAVLHSPTYRKTYKEFLKTDFPRVPAPESDTQFHRLVAFGKQLRELHLMTSPAMNHFVTTYPKDGSNTVEAVSRKNGDVWINVEQYFGNVPDAAWSFYIGGYQPAQKWLKDRKGMTLSSADIEHYQKIIVALAETDRIMHEIDLTP